jgi:hypothetical protein
MKRRRPLALSLFISSLTFIRPPLARAAKQDVLMAIAAILHDKGYHPVEIAKALANRITANKLAQYERYKTLSADPCEVLTNLIGVEAADQFKHFLEKTPSSPTADPTKGGEPC